MGVGSVVRVESFDPTKLVIMYTHYIKNILIRILCGKLIFFCPTFSKIYRFNFRYSQNITFFEPNSLFFLLRRELLGQLGCQIFASFSPFAALASHVCRFEPALNFIVQNCEIQCC